MQCEAQGPDSMHVLRLISLDWLAGQGELILMPCYARDVQYLGQIR